MKSLVQDIESAEFELFEKKLELAISRAYQQGLKDGRSKDAYPPVLRKEHLCEILQASMPAITKIVARPDFPKFHPIQAHYPREQVFDWIARNSTGYEQEFLNRRTRAIAQFK